MRNSLNCGTQDFVTTRIHDNCCQKWDIWIGLIDWTFSWAFQKIQYPKVNDILESETLANLDSMLLAVTILKSHLFCGFWQKIYFETIGNRHIPTLLLFVVWKEAQDNIFVEVPESSIRFYLLYQTFIKKPRKVNFIKFQNILLVKNG